MLDRANEAVQARELFFLLASHELGNPMSTASLLIGTVEMAIDRNPGRSTTTPGRRCG